MKPFVVAAAIEEDPRLHAGTLVRDEAVSIRDANGNVWAPKNYDKTEQGVVRLETVIASSINQATVHLGLGLGLDSILDRLNEYGIPVGPADHPQLFWASQKCLHIRSRLVIRSIEPRLPHTT